MKGSNGSVTMKHTPEKAGVLKKKKNKTQVKAEKSILKKKVKTKVKHENRLCSIT